jgi:nucleoid DNA-binding protein|tara:strand:+ start:94 stop:402 length:309 start_codon:yes stop_codon:yes gene_type:complete
MLKSQILEKLQKKHNNLSNDDIEQLFNIFIKKITNSLRNGQNIEMRGFGTLSRKINKEKFVRNPKTNQKLFKNESYKLHFKIGKILHQKINNLPVTNTEDAV